MNDDDDDDDYKHHIRIVPLDQWSQAPLRFSRAGLSGDLRDL